MRRLARCLVGVSALLIAGLAVLTWLVAIDLLVPRHCQPPADPKRIGVFVVGLGNYVNFTQRLVSTARRFLFADRSRYQVTYFIFTNRPQLAPTGDDVKLIFHRRPGWPLDSMLRPEMYLNYTKSAQMDPTVFDYFYSIDADIYLTGPVGAEFLSDLVAVWHWYHVKSTRSQLPYEGDPASCAYVPPTQGAIYYTGAVYGGRRSNVMNLWGFMARCSRLSLDRDVIPGYHDESILNRYLIDNPPSLIHTPTYYCGEKHFCEWPYERKVLFVIKDYEALQQKQDDD